MFKKKKVKVYVVISTFGSYGDYNEFVEAAFFNKKRADSFLEEYKKKHPDSNKPGTEKGSFINEIEVE